MSGTNLPLPTAERARILSALSTHIGSLERVRHRTGRFVYTPGVGDMATLTGGWWLIGLVALLCRDLQVVRERFQVWTLTVHTDRSATLSVTDGNENALMSHRVPRTSFPLDEISLWLTDGTLLLPSEY